MQTELPTTSHQSLILEASKNINDIISHAIGHTSENKTVVIYDTEDGLARILTAAYQTAVPAAEFIDFASLSKEAIIEKCNTLSPGDLVVLIQSSHFRLDAFRIRLHLFEQGLKVIEHMHLYRNTPDTWKTYVSALAYDPNWYRTTGLALKAKLENTRELKIESPAGALTVTGGVETPKLNIGDYTGMKNIGGTFPIGEVFTEAKDFSHMNGSILIQSFASTDFIVKQYDPFRVDIKDGLVVGWADNAPGVFIDIINMVKTYERLLIREIGFGLNRAITHEKPLGDITAFERVLGLHFSLGEKHSVYKKTGITTKKTKFHIDLFPVVDRVLVDDISIFQAGTYTV